MPSEDLFTLADLPLLEREADILAQEGDYSGLAHITDIMWSLPIPLRAGVHMRIRTPRWQRTSDESVPTDSLITLDPEATLGRVFQQLDPFTKDSLRRAAQSRSKLGKAPENARGVGVYIVVGFEHEVRVRTEEAFERYHPDPPVGRSPHLFELWRFFHQRHLVSGRLANMIDLRNRLVHSPGALGGRVFAAVHFNRLASQAGLIDGGRKGAFHELAELQWLD